MKIRLLGLSSELEVAIQGLKASAYNAGFVLTVSKYYDCRGNSEFKRVYIDMYSPMTKQPLLKDGDM